MSFEDQVAMILRQANRSAISTEALFQKIDSALHHLIERLIQTGTQATVDRREETSPHTWEITVEGFSFVLFSTDILETAEENEDYIEAVVEELFIQELEHAVSGE
ncbi:MULTISPECIES: hypothetical protein [unclassified Paenibacillus]|uniref:hypothetical protein n=1 Tax=unclassified Paenibacillus TaxID=185978 RepID=UPI000FE2587A|nr:MULTISPECIES: hypothetical protein [unclassified Paenibacillus]MCM3175944.1 hypothetical protein [Paenibacillus sp. MER 99-2]